MPLYCLGLTSKGVYFCPYCYITQSELVKGSPHSCDTVDHETFANISENADNYIQDGSPKEKAKVSLTHKVLNNCI